MKRRLCNDTYELWVPDVIADWDAPSAWEVARLEHMTAVLQPGDVVYDIGAEHGWISGIIAQRVGGENMVLVEPSTDLWPNIRLTWEANQFDGPLATIKAFCSATPDGLRLFHHEDGNKWPTSAKGNECHDHLPYRDLNNHWETVASTTIDEIADTVATPKAITIDVEGAEALVLHGAARVLKWDRPHVWCSIHPDLMRKHFQNTEHDVFNYMRSHGYRKRHLATDHEQHWYFWPGEWGDQ